MEGYKIEFNVYADSQQEADAAAKAVKDMIAEYGSKGIAVTARKIESAIRQWKGNPIVAGYFKR